MKPLDPRLLRYAASVRGFLGLGAVLGVVQTALIVAFSFVVAQSVVTVVDGRPGRLPGLLAWLALIVAARSVVVWALEASATRAAVRVKSELRERVVTSAARLGGRWIAEHGSARITTIAGPGLDALDEYFAKYLPQLILTALATPLLVVVLFTQDVLSGVIVVVTLPLIPLFMVLIGWTTRSAQARQFDRLAALSTAFLDAVGGLSTLKVFGRERRQIRRIGTITDDYRRETMGVLRVSFLSGFALEMAASLSVALVAVAIGLRLVGGDLALSTGLFLLLLAPEAYLPLRQVGAHFHAAADGVAAADEAFDLIEAADGATAAETSAEASGGPEASARQPGGSAAGREAVDASGDGVRRGQFLRVRDLGVGYGETRVTAGVDLDLRPGTITALVGPSGSGKTTLLAALLGLVPSEGTRTWSGGGALGLTDIAWSDQRPGLVAGTVRDNVALGSEPGSIDEALVRRSLDRAAADDVDPALVLGPRGEGLSGGQAQRVALARALYRLDSKHLPLLLVDEPTSALDAATEARLVAGLRTAAVDGAAVLVVTHRPAVMAAADSVLRLTPEGLLPATTALVTTEAAP